MVTKRQLGIGAVTAAGLLIIGIIAADIVGAGRWGGFGPLQRIGIALGGGAIVIGLLLIRLGNRPA